MDDNLEIEKYEGVSAGEDTIIDSFPRKLSRSKEQAFGHEDLLTYRHVLSKLVLSHLHKKRTILIVDMTTARNVRKATSCFNQR